MDDVDFVVEKHAIVRNDQTLPRGVPREIERIAKTARELLRGAVGKDAKDFSGIPSRIGRKLIAAIVANADENRTVSAHSRIATMMLGG